MYADPEEANVKTCLPYYKHCVKKGCWIPKSNSRKTSLRQLEKSEFGQTITGFTVSSVRYDNDMVIIQILKYAYKLERHTEIFMVKTTRCLNFFKMFQKI